MIVKAALVFAVAILFSACGFLTSDAPLDIKINEIAIAENLQIELYSVEQKNQSVFLEFLFDDTKSIKDTINFDTVGFSQKHFTLTNSTYRTLTLKIGQTVLDKVEIIQKKEFFYGRYPDGKGAFLSTAAPSIGSPNSHENLQKKYTLSHQAGFYAGEIALSISSKFDIRYTTDGSNPTLQNPNSKWHDGPIYIRNKTNEENGISMIPTTPETYESYHVWQKPDGLIKKATVLKYQLYKSDSAISPTLSSTYFIGFLPKYQMPIISLSAPYETLFDSTLGMYVPGTMHDTANNEWTGNYYHAGEQIFSIEWFSSDGALFLKDNIGIRIHGLRTPAAPQKSLRLYARKVYGKSNINYPFFVQNEYDHYKRLILRSLHSAWGGKIYTDDMMADICRDLDFESMESLPVVVFLNGEYWGIHHLRERMDKNFLKLRFGGKGRDYNILSGQYVARSGNNTTYTAIIDSIKKSQTISDDLIHYIGDKIDFNSLMDYFIAETYFCNYDWPNNNHVYWNNGSDETKWRYMFYDLDGSCGSVSNNYLERMIKTPKNQPNLDWSRFLIRSLLKNDNFKANFISRYRERVNNDFNAERIASIINNFAIKYEAGIDEHIARWHYPESHEKWLNITEELTTFAEERPQFALKHLNWLENLDVTDYELSNTAK